TLSHDLWDDLAQAKGSILFINEGNGVSKAIAIVGSDGKKIKFDFSQGPVNDESQGTVYVLRNRKAKELRSAELYRDSVLVLLIALGIAAFVSLTMSVLLTRPIRKFIDATRALAHGEGDLTKRLEVGSTSEMAELAENL